MTQNRKRLLKHYCTRHFIDRLGALEYSFIVRNKCVECGRDFVRAKKSSKVKYQPLQQILLAIHPSKRSIVIKSTL